MIYSYLRCTSENIRINERYCLKTFVINRGCALYKHVIHKYGIADNCSCKIPQFKNMYLVAYLININILNTYYIIQI